MAEIYQTYIRVGFEPADSRYSFSLETYTYPWLMRSQEHGTEPRFPRTEELLCDSEFSSTLSQLSSPAKSSSPPSVTLVSPLFIFSSLAGIQVLRNTWLLFPILGSAPAFPSVWILLPPIVCLLRSRLFFVFFFFNQTPRLSS